MTMRRFRLIYVAIVVTVLAVSLVWAQQATHATTVTVSHHKQSVLNSTREVGELGWHYNTGEEAIDLLTPECTGYDNCPTVYFRYQGLNQFAAYYTMSTYGGSCAGKTYTVDWWNGSQWVPLIRLSFVHLKNMRSSGQGQLGYDQEYNEWVGDVWEAETCYGWEGSHLHYARGTSYGTNGHNMAEDFGEAGTWVPSAEVVYWANAVY